MPRKKKTEELVQASLGHRISKHEAICAERMKTLFKAIDGGLCWPLRGEGGGDQAMSVTDSNMSECV